MIEIGKLPATPKLSFQLNRTKRVIAGKSTKSHVYVYIIVDVRHCTGTSIHMCIYICDVYIYIYVYIYIHIYMYIMKINPRFVDKIKLSMNIVGVIPPPIPHTFNNFPLKKRGSAEHESEPMTCQPLPNIPSSFMTFTKSSNIPRFGRRFKSWLQYGCQTIRMENMRW